MSRICYHFESTDLPGVPSQKTALLINPPIYDTQYWAEWSQPYGLLRIASLLKQLGYRRRELFDFMEAHGEKRAVAKRRIAPGESFVDKNAPAPKSPPYRIAKNSETLELYKYHFGKSWDQFDAWLDERGFTAVNPPDEVWVSATMSYWWESAVTWWDGCVGVGATKNRSSYWAGFIRALRPNTPPNMSGRISWCRAR